LETQDEIRVTFRPSGKIVEINRGENLIKAFEKAGIKIPTFCAGRGKCGKCKIKLLSEDFPLTANEKIALTTAELDEGIRLACQINPHVDIEIELIDESEFGKMRKLTYGSTIDFKLDSHLKKQYVELQSPSLENPADDLRSIEDNLVSGSQRLNLPITLLQGLSTFLRKNDYRVTFVLSDNSVINIEAGDTTLKSFGLAIDLGTTTIAGTLVDMITGRNLATGAVTNPQNIHGADVISRVNFSMNEAGGLGKLQMLVIDAINSVIENLAVEAGVKTREIYEISIAGNTIMNHILLGVNPQYVGESPYIPTFRRCQSYSAEELGLTLIPRASVMILPNISGYVGGDITSFILAYDLHKRDKVTLSIDIGTNGEIALGSKNGLVCCSAAAGPAFEGGHIGSGMRAETGAIEKIRLADDSIYIETIENGEPKGICGTGLIDIVAEMLRYELIDESGKIVKTDKPEAQWHNDRIVENEDGVAYTILQANELNNKKPIVLSQRDIRELQLAKAAFIAGIKILLKELNLEESDIGSILIAGAFGTYINKYNAQRIGLFPRHVDPEHIEFVGNAASVGAKRFLLSKSARKETDEIIEVAQYIELAARMDFQEEFASGMFFQR